MGKKMTKAQQRRVNKFVLANWKIIAVILAIVLIVGIVAYYMGWLDRFFKKDDDIVLSTAGGYETQVDYFGDLKVTFLNVGQADCMVIQLPDGKNMIIDSGDFSSDEEVISDFTTANNITKFDYLLLTHQDRDHVGNMKWVLETYDVKYIFRPNNYSNNPISAQLPIDFNTGVKTEDAYVSTSEDYAEFMVAAYEEKCTVEIFNKDSDFFNTMICGEDKMSYKFEFLTPTAERSQIAYEEANDYSPILMLEYAGKRIMFNGDAELEALEEYCSTYNDMYDVDILKVGHHGSNNATTQEYIDAIKPEFAVIQNGITKNYKHPHQEVLDILDGADVDIYRTDCNGNIAVTISSLGNISWNFENDDMSKNLINGEEMYNNMAQSLGNIDKKPQNIWKNSDFVLNLGVSIVKREFELKENLCII